MNYIGFRWWRAIKVDGKLTLRSLVQVFDWNLGGITTASHFNGTVVSPLVTGHEAPGEKCQCGLYAWQNLPDALDGDWGQGRVSSYAPQQEQGVLVAGAVLTGGLVCLHGHEGIRAQQARPVAFSVAARNSVHPYITSLAAACGVPVFTYANLEKYAHEFGDRLPA